MKSSLIERPESATSGAPGPVASFLRFVALGGGVGVLASFAVPLLAVVMPWAVSNVIVTVVSTLLCTELHARYTFARGAVRGGGSTGSRPARPPPRTS